MHSCRARWNHRKVEDGEFILTSWGGVVYYVYRDDSHQILLDTREKGTAAGINLYDPKSNVMYMTTDTNDTVVAYRLK